MDGVKVILRGGPYDGIALLARARFIQFPGWPQWAPIRYGPSGQFLDDGSQIYEPVPFDHQRQIGYRL